ncbi:MAG: (Fe-S)-binding protein [Candidatus Bathyarchaeia archaeon]
MVSLKEIGDFLGAAVMSCIRCRSCIWSDLPDFLPICPSYEKYGFYAFSASGKISLVKALVFGSINYDESLADVFYKCTLCGACQENCGIFGKKLVGKEYLEKGWLNITDIIQFIREQLVERGIIFPEHKALLENTLKFGNPFASKRERLKWIEGLDFKIKNLSKESAKILFYPGCMYSFEPTVRETAKIFVRILEKAKVDFGILGEEEVCCGHLQLQIGERGLFQELAEKNIKMLNNLGIEKLVTPCPHCYYTIKKLYPKVAGINFQVQHFAEFLNQLVEDGKLKPTKILNVTITYSDPCNLARFVRIIQEPRNILSKISGIELREMPRSREQTWCCGAGGGVMAAFPDLMKSMAEERINEAKSTGSSIMVTACPWCEYSLKTIAEAGDEISIKILNIAEVFWQAL